MTGLHESRDRWVNGGMQWVSRGLLGNSEPEERSLLKSAAVVEQTGEWHFDSLDGAIGGDDGRGVGEGTVGPGIIWGVAYGVMTTLRRANFLASGAFVTVSVTVSKLAGTPFTTVTGGPAVTPSGTV